MNKLQVDRLCLARCNSALKHCRHRKHNILSDCMYLRSKIKEDKLRKMEELVDNHAKDAFWDMVGLDTCDSKGDDISKEEFVRNEMAWH